MRWIYVVEAVGTGRIKVGITRKSPHERIYGMQTSSPVKLRLAYEYEVETNLDVGRLERYVHGLLHDHRLHGEWFECTVEQAMNAIERAWESRIEKPKDGVINFPTSISAKRQARRT